MYGVLPLLGVFVRVVNELYYSWGLSVGNVVRGGGGGNVGGREGRLL